MTNVLATAPVVSPEPRRGGRRPWCGLWGWVRV